jgi:hypothetical protein
LNVWHFVGCDERLTTTLPDDNKGAKRQVVWCGVLSRFSRSQLGRLIPKEILLKSPMGIKSKALPRGN